MTTQLRRVLPPLQLHCYLFMVLRVLLLLHSEHPDRECRRLLAPLLHFLMWRKLLLGKKGGERADGRRWRKGGKGGGEMEERLVRKERTEVQICSISVNLKCDMQSYWNKYCYLTHVALMDGLVLFLWIVLKWCIQYMYGQKGWPVEICVGGAGQEYWWDTDNAALYKCRAAWQFFSK